MFGLLNLCKPPGLTSRDLVNRVQRLVKPHKVGHAGTLDPLASGVLVVCIGPATRLIEYVQRMPKRYLATFLLGRESDTEDVEGTVTELVDPRVPTAEEILQTLSQFTGRIQQLPPAFSALKVDGQRAYALARKGETPDLRPRPIEVHSIALVDYAYPQLKLDIRCGSGTYVRSLGRDIARALGTAAVMSGLVRTEIGTFQVHEALSGDNITPLTIDQALLSPALALASMPTTQREMQDIALLRYGQPIKRGATDSKDAAEIAVLDADGRLVAIAVPAGEDLWQPRIVFG